MGSPERGCFVPRPALVAAISLALLSTHVALAPAQVPAPVLPVPLETPYTLMDDESRLHFEVGAEAPMRGNGPLTGYIYGFLTRPHFLDKDLYLRMVVAPVYVSAELIHDRWPTEESAIGFGLGGGLFAASQAEFRDGRFKARESFAGDSAEATLAYYHRGPKLFNRLPLEGQIRVRPKYVWYDRTGDTSNRFRLPENSALYEARAGIRLGGMPPELYPDAALELSLWHGVVYRENAGRYGFTDQPQESKDLTQRTWARMGGTYTLWGTQASAYLNAGIAEDTDALSAFRMGGGLRMRTEFPLLLRGYNTDEIFARRYVLVNLAYRFPIWPGQDRVQLELVGDYARVAYVTNHRLPRSGLAGVGANLSFALTRGLTLAVGYGYGVDAPRNRGFGGHELTTLLEYKY
jgi:hypothetical protein